MCAIILELIITHNLLNLLVDYTVYETMYENDAKALTHTKMPLL